MTLIMIDSSKVNLQWLWQVAYASSWCSFYQVYNMRRDHQSRAASGTDELYELCYCYALSERSAICEMLCLSCSYKVQPVFGFHVDACSVPVQLAPNETLVRDLVGMRIVLLCHDVHQSAAQGFPRVRVLACMREQYEEGHSIDDKDALLSKLQSQGGCMFHFCCCCCCWFKC